MHCLFIFSLLCFTVSFISLFFFFFFFLQLSCSGLWIGLPGCLEKFDSLVKEFYAAVENDQTGIVAEAEAALVDLSGPSKLSAEMYIKTLKKVIEVGDRFVDTEIARVEKLRDGKISDNKKEQLNNRLNILNSFQLCQRRRDEL